MLVPKTKPELVAAIAARSNVSKAALEIHTVDRLRELWKLVKPVKVGPVLPVGWRKMDLASLKAMYEDYCVPDLQREHDGHWQRWKRSQLILELSMWEADTKEAQQQMAKDQAPEIGSLCPACAIPFILRTNRLDKTNFWGCARFPECRETLPLTSAGLETKEVMKARAALMPPTARKRQYRSRGSDDSWSQVGAGESLEDTTEDEPDRTVNVNLTEAEMIEIQRMRRQGTNLRLP